VCNISLSCVDVHVWCVEGHGEGQLERGRVDGLGTVKNRRET
jgi:hypothetical protein